MDIALTLKIINLIYKFTNSRHNELPDNFSNYVTGFLEASPHDDIKISKNSTLNRKYIDKFIYELKQDNRVNLAGIGIMHGGKLIKEEYIYPHTSSYRHVSFSMSKSIVSMAVGIAIDKKILSLNEHLVDIFPEHDSVFIKRGMKNVTIESLLTMTSGVSFDEISAFFSEDWCLAYMGSDIKYESESEFSYNSLNTYMLVAAICKKSNMSFQNFLYLNLFKYMGINDVTWDKCPQGIEIGGWGLKLSLMDMLKLGQLYLNEGKWIVDNKEVRLIDANWVKESTRRQVSLNDKEVISGYGYQIWILKDGAYLFNGLFGQNIYVNPNKNLVIAVMASAYEVFPGGTLVRKICDFANDDLLYHRGFITNIKNIVKKPKYDLIKRNKIRYDAETFFTVISDYLDNKYIFYDYSASILPICVQGFYSMFSMGIRSLRFKRIKSDLFMIVEENDTEFTIQLGYVDNEFKYQIIDYGGKQMPMAAYCSLAFDEDDRFMLKIRLVFLEEVGERILKIFFSSNSITLKGIESPDLKEFVGILFGESRLRGKQLTNKINMPDYLEYKVDKILSPVSKGDVNI